MKKLSILWLSISSIAYLNGAEEAQQPLTKKHELSAGAVVNSVNFSNDGKLAAGLVKNKIPIWNFSDDSFTELDITSRALGDIAWSPDNIQLAASNGKAIELINTNNAKSLLIQNTIIPKLPTGVVKYMVPSNPSWNYDGSQLAWGSFQQRGTNFVSIWNIAQQRMVHNLRRHKSYVNAVRYHPTDVVLASGSADSNTGAGLRTGTLCIWDMRSGQCTQDLRGHGLTTPASLDWNSNGFLLASASGTTVHIWDIRNNQCFQLPGADARAFLTDLCWHPNGQFLATSSRNQTVSLWNTHDETCLQVLPADTSSTDHRSTPITVPRKQPGVFSVDWNQKGTLLASGSGDGIVRIWEYQQKVDDEEPVTAASDESHDPNDSSAYQPRSEKPSLLPYIPRPPSPKSSSADDPLYDFLRQPHITEPDNSDSQKEELDGKDESEAKEISTLLAIADQEKIVVFIRNQATLQEDQRVVEGGTRILRYHPSGLTLSAVKGDNTITNLIHDDRGLVIDENYPLPEVVDSIAYHPSQKLLAASYHVDGDLPCYYILVYNLVADEREVIFEVSNREDGTVTLAYDPPGNYLAATNDVRNTVTMLSVNQIGELSFPTSFSTEGKGSLRTAFSPKGRVLSTINALSDNVTVFVYDFFGSLLNHGIYGSGGRHPVDLDYDLTGDYLAVAHSNSKDITLLFHDKRKRLGYLSRYTLDQAPTSLAFKPLPIIQEKKDSPEGDK